MVSSPISLEGISNIRDLGGMVNKEGYKVRSHLLIRSAMLSDATEEDLRILYEDYDVRDIFDFRSKREKDERPDPEYRDMKYHEITVHTDRMFAIEQDEESQRKMMEYFRDVFTNPLNQKKHMIGFYRMLANEYGISQYGVFLNLVYESEHGCLWHCSVGKDRSGLGTALVEALLDIDMEDIIEDYIYSNICRHGHNEPEETVEGYGDFCHREYIEAFFDEINTRFGSIDRMFESIGFDGKKRKAFRKKYLEGYPE